MATYTDAFTGYPTGTLEGNGLWVNVALGTSVHTTGGTVTDSSSLQPSAAYYNNTFGGDQYAEAQLVTMGTTADQGAGPIVRGGSVLGYFAQCNLSGGGEVRIYKITSGPTYTQVGSTFTGTLANGDTIRLTATGSAQPVTLAVTRNGAALFSVTDTASGTVNTAAGVLTGGRGGIATFDTPVVLDNWAGGDVSAGGPTMALAQATAALTGKGTSLAFAVLMPDEP